jgi:tetratricopeptide (TPR) repeat protein
LVQLNRGDEGLAVASELLKLPTKDESVLSTLTHTFRALRDNASAIRCYELMLEMNPNSEKHAKELFFALAKAGEVRRMQKTASLLYKGMGKRRYLFWTVCCLLTAEPPTTMVYALADKMLTRLLFEVFPDSRPGYEELKLYLSVLLKQPQRRGDAMEALRQLSGRRAEPPLQDQDSEQSVPATALQLLELGQELMQAGGDWRGELDRLDGILAQYPDQWSALKRRADILCEHQIGHDDQALVLAHSQLQQAQTLYPGLRGPFLAELYVLSRVQGRQAADLWGADAMVRAVCGYVDRFSAKPSCFSDLKPYIEGLRSDGRLAAIVTFLDTSIAAAGAQSASGSSAASLCRMSKLRQLRFLCDMESADLSACIELVRLYPVSEKPAAKGGDKDVTPGDELLLLAGTALRRLGRGGPEGCFARAVVADYGQCVSPHSFALKVCRLSTLSNQQR